MDFSNITSRNKLLGTILRFPLDLIPKNAVVPVLQGELRGMRWIVGASRHVCWLGSYEIQKQTEVANHLKPGDVFYDVGANVGFYTLLASKAVGKQGQVYAFEPFPRNIPYIQQHVTLNKLQNVTVYEMAIADHDGLTHFQQGDNNSHTTGKVSDNGTLAVKVAALDSLVFKEGLRPPNIIKIDVEGGEYDVLRGAERLLTEKSPIIFLATHGSQIHQQCVELLTKINYKIETFPSADGGGELIATK